MSREDGADPLPRSVEALRADSLARLRCIRARHGGCVFLRLVADVITLDVGGRESADRVAEAICRLAESLEDPCLR